MGRRYSVKHVLISHEKTMAGRAVQSTYVIRDFHNIFIDEVKVSKPLL